MEYTQWDKQNNWLWKKFSLNPCCNGIYSMRERNLCLLFSFVLILVVMEYTQWESPTLNKIVILSLNPCCNGIYSMRFIW